MPVSLPTNPRDDHRQNTAFLQTAQLNSGLGIPRFSQGATNGCGTTSLAMIMSSLGKEYSPDEIDARIRRSDTGTSVQNMLDFARENGLSAECYNDSSLDEIKQHLIAGRGVQVMFDTADASAVADHYAVVTGFSTDTNGNEQIHLIDPNGGRNVTMSAEEFMERWQSRVGDVDRFMAVFGAESDVLPPSRIGNAAEELAVMDFVNDRGNEGVVPTACDIQGFIDQSISTDTSADALAAYVDAGKAGAPPVSPAALAAANNAANTALAQVNAYDAQREQKSTELNRWLAERNRLESEYNALNAPVEPARLNFQNAADHLDKLQARKAEFIAQGVREDRLADLQVKIEDARAARDTAKDQYFRAKEAANAKHGEFVAADGNYQRTWGELCRINDSLAGAQSSHSALAATASQLAAQNSNWQARQAAIAAAPAPTPATPPGAPAADETAVSTTVGANSTAHANWQAAVNASIAQRNHVDALNLDHLNKKAAFDLAEGELVNRQAILDTRILEFDQAKHRVDSLRERLDSARREGRTQAADRLSQELDDARIELDRARNKRDHARDMRNQAVTPRDNAYNDYVNALNLFNTQNAELSRLQGVEAGAKSTYDSSLATVQAVDPESAEVIAVNNSAGALQESSGGVAGQEQKVNNLQTSLYTTGGRLNQARLDLADAINKRAGFDRAGNRWERWNTEVQTLKQTVADYEADVVSISNELAIEEKRLNDMRAAEAQGETQYAQAYNTRISGATARHGEQLAQSQAQIDEQRTTLQTARGEYNAQVEEARTTLNQNRDEWIAVRDEQLRQIEEARATLGDQKEEVLQLQVAHGEAPEIAAALTEIDQRLHDLDTRDTEITTRVDDALAAIDEQSAEIDAQVLLTTEQFDAQAGVLDAAQYELDRNRSIDISERLGLLDPTEFGARLDAINAGDFALGADANLFGNQLRLNELQTERVSVEGHIANVNKDIDNLQKDLRRATDAASRDGIRGQIDEKKDERFSLIRGLERIDSDIALAQGSRAALERAENTQVAAFESAITLLDDTELTEALRLNLENGRSALNLDISQVNTLEDLDLALDNSLQDSLGSREDINGQLARLRRQRDRATGNGNTDRAHELQEQIDNLLGDRRATNLTLETGRVARELNAATLTSATAERDTSAAHYDAGIDPYVDQVAAETIARNNFTLDILAKKDGAHGALIDILDRQLAPDREALAAFGADIADLDRAVNTARETLTTAQGSGNADAIADAQTALAQVTQQRDDTIEQRDALQTAMQPDLDRLADCVQTLYDINSGRIDLEAANDIDFAAELDIRTSDMMLTANDTSRAHQRNMSHQSAVDVLNRDLMLNEMNIGVEEGRLADVNKEIEDVRGKIQDADGPRKARLKARLETLLERRDSIQTNLTGLNRDRTTLGGDLAGAQMELDASTVEVTENLARLTGLHEGDGLSLGLRISRDNLDHVLVTQDDIKDYIAQGELAGIKADTSVELINGKLVEFNNLLATADASMSDHDKAILEADIDQYEEFLTDALGEQKAAHIVNGILASHGEAARAAVDNAVTGYDGARNAWLGYRMDRHNAEVDRSLQVNGRKQEWLTRFTEQYGSLDTLAAEGTTLTEQAGLYADERYETVDEMHLSETLRTGDDIRDSYVAVSDLTRGYDILSDSTDAAGEIAALIGAEDTRLAGLRENLATLEGELRGAQQALRRAERNGTQEEITSARQDLLLADNAYEAAEATIGNLTDAQFFNTLDNEVLDRQADYGAGLYDDAYFTPDGDRESVFAANADGEATGLLDAQGMIEGDFLDINAFERIAKSAWNGNVVTGEMDLGRLEHDIAEASLGLMEAVEEKQVVELKISGLENLLTGYKDMRREARTRINDLRGQLPNARGADRNAILEEIDDLNKAIRQSNRLITRVGGAIQTESASLATLDEGIDSGAAANFNTAAGALNHERLDQGLSAETFLDGAELADQYDTMLDTVDGSAAMLVGGGSYISALLQGHQYGADLAALNNSMQGRSLMYLQAMGSGNVTLGEEIGESLGILTRQMTQLGSESQTRSIVSEINTQQSIFDYAVDQADSVGIRTGGIARRGHGQFENAQVALTAARDIDTVRSLLSGNADLIGRLQDRTFDTVRKELYAPEEVADNQIYFSDGTEKAGEVKFRTGDASLDPEGYQDDILNRSEREATLGTGMTGVKAQRLLSNLMESGPSDGALSVDELTAIYRQSDRHGDTFIEAVYRLVMPQETTGVDDGDHGRGRRAGNDSGQELSSFQAFVDSLYTRHFGRLDEGDDGRWPGRRVGAEPMSKDNLFRELVRFVDPGAFEGSDGSLSDTWQAQYNGTFGDDRLTLDGNVMIGTGIFGMGDDSVATRDGRRVNLTNSLLHMGDGRDVVDLQGALGNSSIYLGNSNDRFSLAGLGSHSLVSGGNQADTLNAGGILSNMRFHGDRGQDSLGFGGQLTNFLSDAGEDDDRLTLSGHMENAQFQLGDGNDYAVVAESFRGEATLNDTHNSTVNHEGKYLKYHDTVILDGTGWSMRGGAGGYHVLERKDNNGAVLATLRVEDNIEHIETTAGEVLHHRDPKVLDTPFGVIAGEWGKALAGVALSAINPALGAFYNAAMTTATGAANDDGWAIASGLLSLASFGASGVGATALGTGLGYGSRAVNTVRGLSDGDVSLGDIAGVATLGLDIAGTAVGSQAGVPGSPDFNPAKLVTASKLGLVSSSINAAGALGDMIDGGHFNPVTLFSAGMGIANSLGNLHSMQDLRDAYENMSGANQPSFGISSGSVNNVLDDLGNLAGHNVPLNDWGQGQSLESWANLVRETMQSPVERLLGEPFDPTNPVHATLAINLTRDANGLLPGQAGHNFDTTLLTSITGGNLPQFSNPTEAAAYVTRIYEQAKNIPGGSAAYDMEAQWDAIITDLNNAGIGGPGQTGRPSPSNPASSELYGNDATITRVPGELVNDILPGYGLGDSSSAIPDIGIGDYRPISQPESDTPQFSVTPLHELDEVGLSASENPPNNLAGSFAEWAEQVRATLRRNPIQDAIGDSPFDPANAQHQAIARAYVVDSTGLLPGQKGYNLDSTRLVAETGGNLPQFSHPVLAQSYVNELYAPVTGQNSMNVGETVSFGTGANGEISIVVGPDEQGQSTIMAGTLLQEGAVDKLVAQGYRVNLVLNPGKQDFLNSLSADTTFFFGHAGTGGALSFAEGETLTPSELGAYVAQNGFAGSNVYLGACLDTESLVGFGQALGITDESSYGKTLYGGRPELTPEQSMFAVASILNNSYDVSIDSLRDCFSDEVTFDTDVDPASVSGYVPGSGGAGVGPMERPGGIIEIDANGVEHYTPTRSPSRTATGYGVDVVRSRGETPEQDKLAFNGMKFDPQNADHVRLLQTQINEQRQAQGLAPIAVDGVYGPQTQAALHAAGGGTVGSIASTGTPQEEKIRLNVHGSNMLFDPNNAEHVRRMQRFLGTTVTGIMNNETSQAIRSAGGMTVGAYNDQHGDPASIADFRAQEAGVSWDLVSSSGENTFEGTIQLQQSAEFNSVRVRAAQEELQRIGLYRGPINGDLTEETIAAMREFKDRSNQAAPDAFGEGSFRLMRQVPSGFYSPMGLAANIQHGQTVSTGEWLAQPQLSLLGLPDPELFNPGNPVQVEVLQDFLTSVGKETGLVTGILSATDIQGLQEYLQEQGQVVTLTGRWDAQTIEAWRGYEDSYWAPVNDLASLNVSGRPLPPPVVGSIGSEAKFNLPGGFRTGLSLRFAQNNRPETYGEMVDFSELSVRVLGDYTSADFRTLPDWLPVPLDVERQLQANPTARIRVTLVWNNPTIDFSSNPFTENIAPELLPDSVYFTVQGRGLGIATVEHVEKYSFVRNESGGIEGLQPSSNGNAVELGLPGVTVKLSLGGTPEQGAHDFGIALKVRTPFGELAYGIQAADNSENVRAHFEDMLRYANPGITDELVDDYLSTFDAYVESGFVDQVLQNMGVDRVVPLPNNAESFDDAFSRSTASDYHPSARNSDGPSSAFEPFASETQVRAESLNRAADDHEGSIGHALEALNSDDITRFQAVASNMGLYEGSIDGNAGPLTHQAAREVMLEAARLSPDYRVDRLGNIVPDLTSPEQARKAGDLLELSQLSQEIRTNGFDAAMEQRFADLQQSLADPRVQENLSILSNINPQLSQSRDFINALDTDEELRGRLLEMVNRPEIPEMPRLTPQQLGQGILMGAFGRFAGDPSEADTPTQMVSMATQILLGFTGADTFSDAAWFASDIASLGTDSPAGNGETVLDGAALALPFVSRAVVGVLPLIAGMVRHADLLPDSARGIANMPPTGFLRYGETVDTIGDLAQSVTRSAIPHARNIDNYASPQLQQQVQEMVSRFGYNNVSGYARLQEAVDQELYGIPASGPIMGTSEAAQAQELTARYLADELSGLPNYNHHFPFGAPHALDENAASVRLNNDSFLNFYSTSRRNPVAAGQHLSDYRLERASGSEFNRPRWDWDPRIDTRDQLAPNALRSSDGMNRGHIIPNYSTKMQYGREGQLETFVMTNVSPQDIWHNANPWAQLEHGVADFDIVRPEMRNHVHDVWDTVLPIFGANSRGVRRQPSVQIPEAFGRIVTTIDPQSGNLQTLAIIVPTDISRNRPHTLGEFAVTLEEFERRTGMRFLTDFTDDVHAAIAVRRPDGNFFDLNMRLSGQTR